MLTQYIRNKIPWIRVLKLPNNHPLREYGEYITLDNRRLFCFRMVLMGKEHANVECDIPVDIRNKGYSGGEIRSDACSRVKIRN